MFQGVEYYARLPSDAPGFYLLLWKQGELHGNELCKATKACATFPILEFGTPTFYASLRSLWAIIPAVVVRLPSSAAKLKTMTKKLQADLEDLKEPVGHASAWDS